MARRKQQVVVNNVTFTGIADKGLSVGRDEEGRVVFADGVVPGDVADVLVLRKKGGYMVGVPQTIHAWSGDRVEPFCAHFGVCGGCKWQHLSYEAQARHKQEVVESALTRIARLPADKLLPILAAEETRYYRNKLEFTFSSKRWLTTAEVKSGISNEADVLGFHPPGAFDKVIDVQHCWLQEDPCNEIRNASKAVALEMGLPFFDHKANTGFLRQLMIRVTTIGEVLVVFSFYKGRDKLIAPFLEAVLAQHPQITTLAYCINPKVNDYMFDLDILVQHGKGYIEEVLGHVRFRIGPKSFFQTNTRQGKRLYDVVAEFAALTGQENVYDLYTGIGSIALYLARQCRQVVGIEEIPEAIADAKVNAQLNDISNTLFYAGDVKEVLSEDFAQAHGRPDLLITDPPRAGMHPSVVAMLLQLAAPRMVYVSCNPATQARDLALLGEKYEVEKVRPVDMFPHTSHIESVALLVLRG